MSGKIKNQHYVPRMYLKRFSTNGNKISVWKFEDNSIIVNQNPKNFAVERFFYDSNQDEIKEAMKEMTDIYPNIESLLDSADEQFVEKYLANMEADIVGIMNTICDDYNKLYIDEHMEKLVIFFHTLAYRTYKFRTTMNDIREQTLHFLNEFGYSNFIQEVSKTGKESQLYELLGVAPLIKTGCILFENYNWYFGIVQGNMKLLISDNPAQGIMLGFNDICIPLCSDKAIIFRIKNSGSPIISKDMPNGKIIDLSENSVLAYNIIQSSYAEKFMFGDRKSLELLRNLKTKYTKRISKK